MHILLANDDGIQAEGLKILAATLRQKHRVTICAPEFESSGIAHALSLHRPLLLKKWAEGDYSVDGTPTDAVFTAFNHLLKDDLPDLVVSGINPGPNLGHDVTYSGTVGAALEGSFFARPAIAVSLGAPSKNAADFAAAAAALAAFIELIPWKKVGNILINMNIPLGVKAPYEFKAATLERGRMQTSIVPTIDPRGKERLWIGGVPNDLPSSPGSDRAVLNSGFIAVTALSLMAEDEAGQKELIGWLG